MPQIGKDFGSFLKLLTTQLQNQDPSAPMDSNQFTTQLVQFASVEQQINMNTNVQNMVTLEQGAQLTASAPLMGRRIEVSSDSLSLQSGQATLTLPASGAAVSAHITVLDAAGRVLKSDDIVLSSGPSSWSWDGQGTGGRRMPDGAYRVAVTGVDAGGSPSPITFGVVATATGAERTNGNINLALGALSVGFDKVKSLLSN
jgi:flagellar basal-body rod modification protein FlgD